MKRAIKRKIGLGILILAIAATCFWAGCDKEVFLEQLDAWHAYACMRILRIFDLVWIATGEGPGSASHILSTVSYTKSFIAVPPEFGIRSAFACVTTLLMLPVGIWLIKVRLR